MSLNLTLLILAALLTAAAVVLAWVRYNAERIRRTLGKEHRDEIAALEERQAKRLAEQHQNYEQRLYVVRDQYQESSKQLGRALQEVGYFAGTRLPEYIRTLQDGQEATPLPMYHQALGDAWLEEFDKAFWHVKGGQAAEGDRVEADVHAAVRESAMSGISELNNVRSRLKDLQDHYEELRAQAGDDLPMQQALSRHYAAVQDVDRGNEIAGSVLQRLLILTNQAPDWSPGADTHLADIVAAAQARITGGEQLHIVPHLERPVAVQAPFVEVVTAMVRELCDNAVRFTSGTKLPQVHLHEAANGAVLEVIDAGIGIQPEDVQFCRDRLTGNSPRILSGVGSPARLGMAVIGALRASYSDITVDVAAASRYGGTTATLFVPRGRLTVIEEPQSAPTAAQPDTSPAPTPAAVPAARADLPPLPPRRKQTPPPQQDEQGPAPAQAEQPTTHLRSAPYGDGETR